MTATCYGIVFHNSNTAHAITSALSYSEFIRGDCALIYTKIYWLGQVPIFATVVVDNIIDMSYNMTTNYPI